MLGSKWLVHFMLKAEIQLNSHHFLKRVLCKSGLYYVSVMDWGGWDWEIPAYKESWVKLEFCNIILMVTAVTVCWWLIPYICNFIFTGSLSGRIFFCLLPEFWKKNLKESPKPAWEREHCQNLYTEGARNGTADRWEARMRNSFREWD